MQPPEALPIQPRVLWPVLLLALAAWAPTAAAQVDVDRVVRLEPSPPSANVTAGEAGVFRVALRNDALFPVTVRLVADEPPVDWTYNFTPAVVTLPAQGANNTTLVVYVPASAPAGADETFSFHAEHAGTGSTASPVSSVTVHVLTRPPPPPPSEPAKPQLALSVTQGDGAEEGRTATGTLTLLNQDARVLRVSLAIAGDPAWSPRILPENQFRALDVGGAPVAIPLHADVPPLDANRTRDFTVTATVDGHVFRATWTVAGFAIVGEAPAQEPDAPAQPGAEDANATGPRRVDAPAGPGLSVLVVPETIDIAPGADAAAYVRLTNTGGVPLRVSLAGTAAESWPVRFNATSVDLPAGERLDVLMTVTAPLGIPVGGLGAGNVVATTDGGLVRTSGFRLHVVQGAPRDETPAAAMEVPAPAADGGAPSVAATVVVAAALGAVGAGALALTRRPLREKIAWAAVGLYTRLARPDVLGHDDRAKLYKLVEETPGVHFHALQRELGWNTGTLTYHVRVLERHGFLVSRRDGLYRRFYLAGAAPRKETFNNGPSGLRADVLEAVRTQHGISQSDLALALGANKQTVNYHVKALERQGLIRVEKRGRDTYLYPASAPSLGPGSAHA